MEMLRCEPRLIIREFAVVMDFAELTRFLDWKKDLQICGAGRKSRKRPTLVVGKKPNGECQLIWIAQTRMNLRHNDSF